MTRNVPIALKNPDVPVCNADKWLKLRGLARVNSEFTAVEIKSFYVIGLLIEIFASVDWLLKAEKLSRQDHPLTTQIFNAGGAYLPAFGILASGIELLGRCLTGNSSVKTKTNFDKGFSYLIESDLNSPPLSKESVVVTTEHYAYTIDHLTNLRNYAAHGQATMGQKTEGQRSKNEFFGIDRGVFKKFPKLVGDAIDVYWASLGTDEESCINMAKARLDPYSNRVQPLQHTIEYFSRLPSQSAGSMFYGFDWS